MLANDTSCYMTRPPGCEPEKEGRRGGDERRPLRLEPGTVEPRVTE